ncbi:MAG: Daunorubicin/doxorubicin resistance ATP-binding protein DrrA [Candidatus Thorarchaeota archaeon AB_25]|nr:MAG: Daunorubicin/doxorubicin resistance ATP-binding protein DrrA [Candidatus Thorarchaeota archaeon AB_25]
MEVVRLDEVTISGLTKNFGDLVAVDHMDLNIPEGTIFGLLGPNGAGKSTTTRLLSTLLRPTEGTAMVGGFDIIEEPVHVREITGVLPEESNHTIYGTLTAYENLQYFARLYDVPEEEIDERIEELLTFMALWDRKDDKAGELSTGNRQRLALCRAILHRPRVLLLDEPTSALDPIAAKRVRELILSLSQKFKQTFFINSHNLPEVQRVCDQIAIIDEGKVLLHGSTQELRSKLLAKQRFRIRIVGDIENASSIAKSMNFVEEVNNEIDSIIVTIEDPTENNSSLMQSLLSQGIKIVEFAEEEATLEDLYLEVVKGGDA